MHTERKRLPNRRSAETWDVEALGLHFKTSVGRYDDGRIGEIFLSNHRVNSMAGIMASDSAVLCSLLLQYGVPLDVIRHALMRDPRGKPSGPLGVVLDRLAADEETA
jgi:ribonucleoside-diphosphate reductase alpha chain